MMAAEGGDVVVTVRYVYRGEEGEIIPREATHIFVLARVILGHAFDMHPNIVEVICHEDVEIVGEYAFYGCPNLRRVVMPGVRILERAALCNCPALTDVECGKLEIIGEDAFWHCVSLTRIDLQSAMIVEKLAFTYCKALVEAKFGNKLERIEESALSACLSLERITIPLKAGFITNADIFIECGNLKRVDLVEGEVHETIAAFQLEEWRNDMNEVIESINETLPNARAGGYDEDFNKDEGEKARAIRRWSRSVIRKIIRYQAEHRRVLDEAATTLQFALPQDIAMNHVLPFLELPHSLDEEDQEMEDEDGDDE